MASALTCQHPQEGLVGQRSRGPLDGDGIADSSDVCVGIYDPLQWDTDGDGVGDDCDD